jgi:nitrogen fixation protein FixH
MSSEPQGRVIRGKHVLFGMFAMFGLVIAVNLVFVWFALDTFTGVSTENPYKEGLAYNQVLAARDAQRDTGWQGAVTYDREGAREENGPRQITVSLSDRNGKPLSGLSLDGSLRRPTHAGVDQPLVWRETAPGRYTAEVSLPELGNWDLAVSARDGDGPPFEMKARLWFK